MKIHLLKFLNVYKKFSQFTNCMFMFQDKFEGGKVDKNDPIWEGLMLESLQHVIDNNVANVGE